MASKTKITFGVVGCLLIAAYLASVGCGAWPFRNTARLDKDFIAAVAEEELGGNGTFAARRVFPRFGEWLPFQSVYVVSRDGRDCARVTTTRWPLVKKSWSTLEAIG